MNPNQMTHKQKMAEMVARLAERMQNRRIRTVKEAAERDREQLIEMRRRGMPIQEVATAYQEMSYCQFWCISIC